ncbi:MAG TPA: type II toxin-antitoxin system HicB family antitoxin [Gemmatimonadaceae bacterium]|nr:type II toxin-antitoxin system HicB family antitoxin [Gemmatimonadaceae bacterium]
MKRYAIVIYKASGNYSAHVLDADGCIATGRTVKETASNIRDALEFHLEAMADDGEAIPEPTAVVEYVEVNISEPAKRKAG